MSEQAQKSAKLRKKTLQHRVTNTEIDEGISELPPDQADDDDDANNNNNNNNNDQEDAKTPLE